MNTDNILTIQDIRPKKPLQIEDSNSHKTIRNRYIKWFFKKQQDYVILRQFKNKEKEIKMFIALPVREREFVSNKIDLFDINKLNNIDFPLDIKNIKTYDTIYSGHMDNFNDFPRYLSNFRFTRKQPSVSRWGTEEKITLFKDYTTTKIQQEHNFTLVSSFTDPYISILSIFRLLQTKYITIVGVTFTPDKYDKNDKDLI